MTPKYSLHKNKYIKSAFLFVCVNLFICISNANAGVKFITELGTDENFKENFNNTFKCSDKYITCQSPTIGKGTTCDGKFLSCVCPSEFVECKSPKVGSGTACDGKYKSENCKCPNEFATLCNGSNNIITTGAATCDGKYKQADCKCPSNWFDAKNCPKPMVLSGNHCDTQSSVYTVYEKCTCPSEYITCSDTGPETGTSTCTEKDGTVKYATCASGKSDCAELVAKVAATEEGGTIEVKDNILCQNTTITLRPRQTLKGIGNASINFIFDDNQLRPGVLMSNASTISNLTVTAEIKAKEGASGTGTGGYMGGYHGLLRIAENATGVLFKDLNISYETTYVGNPGHFVYGGIKTSDTPTSFDIDGTVSIEEKGTVHSDVANQGNAPTKYGAGITYKYSVSVDNGSNIVMNMKNNAVLNIKTVGYNSIGLQNVSINMRDSAKINVTTHGISAYGVQFAVDQHIKMVDNSQINIKTTGQFSNSMYASNAFMSGQKDPTMTIDGNAVVNILSTGPKSNGWEGGRNVTLLNNAKINVKKTGVGEGHYGISYLNPTLRNNSRINVYVTGNDAPGVYGGTWNLYDKSSVNSQNTGQDTTAGYGDAPAFKNIDFYFNDANSIIRAMAKAKTFSGETSWSVLATKLPIGLTIYTDEARFVAKKAHNANSGGSMVSKVLILNKMSDYEGSSSFSYNIDTHFTRDTSLRLLAMPEDFKSEFNTSFFNN